MQATRYNSAIRKTAAMLTCAAALVCWKPKIDRIGNVGMPAAAAAQKQSAQDEAGIKKRVDALIIQLDSTDGVKILRAQHALEAMGPSIIPLLLKAMPTAKSNGSEQQAQIILTIIQLGEPAIPELRKCLKHADVIVRIGALAMLNSLKAVNRLGSGADEGIALEISGLLADNDERVQNAASETLPKFGQAAIAPLVRELGNTRNKANAFAGAALSEIGAPAAPYIITAMEKDDIPTRIMAEAALMKMGKAAVPALIKGLGNKVAVVRIGCATALGGAKDERALPALARAAKEDESEVVRTASSEAIALIRKGGAKPPGAKGVDSLKPSKLVEAMGSDDAATRRAATSALMKMDKAAVPALLAGLNNRNLEVQIASADALGRIGDEKAVKPLLRLVPKGDHRLRAAAIEALGNIGDRSAMPALIKAANDKDDLVQKTAIAAMLRIDPNSIH